MLLNLNHQCASTTTTVHHFKNYIIIRLHYNAMQHKTERIRQTETVRCVPAHADTNVSKYPERPSTNMTDKKRTLYMWVEYMLIHSWTNKPRVRTSNEWTNIMEHCVIIACISLYTYIWAMHVFLLHLCIVHMRAVLDQTMRDIDYKYFSKIIFLLRYGTFFFYNVMGIRDYIQMI